jgi:hypothetical protein
MANNDGELAASLNLLNNNPSYDISTTMNNILHNEDTTNTFININLKTSFFDLENFISTYKKSKIPLFLSTNIQSLQSKFNELKILITHLLNNSIQIAVIALQEIWQVRYPELFDIPGFHPLMYKQRQGARGGGVGIYVNSNLKYKIINVSRFIPFTFEISTIELQLQNKLFYISNIYHSPTPPPLDQLLLIMLTNLSWKLITTCLTSLTLTNRHMFFLMRILIY